jgi:hypothetical protein
MNRGAEEGMGSFAEVSGLPDGELRELLGSSDEVTRVWAAWALGLRLGGRVAATLTEVVHEAPEPGVRRQLAVILAGLGKLDVLLAMADGDPDAWARATAARYVARLAVTRPAAWAAVARLLGDHERRVREVLVQEVPRAVPAPVRTARLARAADVSADVRRALLERVEEDAEDTELAGALRAQLPGEPEAELRRRGYRLWIDRAGMGSLVVALGAPAHKLVCLALLTARKPPAERQGFAREVTRLLELYLRQPEVAERPIGRSGWRRLVGLRRAMQAELARVEPVDDEGEAGAVALLGALVGVLDAVMRPLA